MKKALKLFGFIAFTFVLFLIVAALAFYHLIRVGEFRRFLISELEQRTELKVQLGQADLELGWILGIAFRDLALAEPDAAQPAITAQRMTARVALLPLLQRQLIFYEVRLHKPIARMARDAEGHIPLLDKLLNLPFLKQEATQFGLDLRAIKIDGGEVDFEDQGAEAGTVATRFRDIDVEIERIRGRELRDFVRELMRLKLPEPQGAVLDFELKSVVERDSKKATVRAKGQLVFPKEALELRKAWWNADLQLTDLPAETVQQTFGTRLPVKSINGTLAPRFRLEGNPAERIHLKGDLLFKKLAVDAPDFFLAPLAAGDGRADFDVEWSPQRLGISRLDFRSSELKLVLQGRVLSLDSKDPQLQVSLSAASLPLAALRRYLPLKIMQSPQLESFAAVFKEGELQLKNAGVNASLSELRSMAQTGFDQRIWFDAELRNAGGKLSGEGFLPLRGMQGRLRLEKGVLFFKNVEGTYGQSRLTEIDGSYQMAAPSRGVLELHARGELDLAELREQLKFGVLGAQTTKLAASIPDMDGTGKIDLTLRATPDSPLQFEGKILLDNARLRLEELSLTDLKGELALAPKEIKAEKVRALISGSPVQIQLVLRGYGADNGTFDLGIESTGVKAGMVMHLLLGSGSLQDPGIVRGSVRYQGSLATKKGRKFTGNLDLVNVQLSTRPLLQPLREVNGRVRIDETGIDFQNLQGLLVGSPAHFSGRWRYGEKPQLLFDFAAPSLDIGYLLSQINSESSEFYATLQATGKIALAKGRLKSLEFADLKTDAVIERRVWRLSNLAMRASGGTLQGVATIADKPDGLGFFVEPKIHGVPVQSLLGWFDIASTEVTGKVNLSGQFESAGKDGAERKRNLNGAFKLRIEDGTTRRLGIAVRILNLLDLSRWFSLQLPDFNKQGVHFRSLTGDFKIAKGVYSTQNLILDSDDLRMTGAGKIDVPNDEIDFVVATRPFPGVDTAINYIPLIGRGIAAIKNSFLVASFNVKGPIDDPTITPAPLSTLSEVFFGVLGIPKNIIGLGGDENKDESTQERPKEPLKEKAAPPTP